MVCCCPPVAECAAWGIRIGPAYQRGVPAQGKAWCRGRPAFDSTLSHGAQFHTISMAGTNIRHRLHLSSAAVSAAETGRCPLGRRGPRSPPPPMLPPCSGVATGQLRREPVVVFGQRRARGLQTACVPKASSNWQLRRVDGRAPPSGTVVAMLASEETTAAGPEGTAP